MARVNQLRGLLALACAAGAASSVLAQDVTRPGDLYVGLTANYPAAESPDKVGDNTAGTKYLNFDEVNTGFSVTPSGTGIVRGLVLVTANDAPERDPSSYIFEGSDDGATWVLIAQGTLNPPTARYAFDQVSFANDTAYAQYRVTFPTVRNSNAANSMQVAEVQLVTATNVLTPGDPFTVVYTDGQSSPVNEGPANLFDRRAGTKFGVFNGNAGPLSIDVTPGVGASTITGLDLWGGNDDANWPGRTPAYITLYGSNDGVNFTQIYNTALTQVTQNYQDQDYAFENTASYTRYRIEFGPCTDGFMQLGEIQLIGTAATAAPANDTCANAQPVTAGDTAGANFNATGTDTTDCGTNDTTDVWYRYVAGATGPLEINTFGAGVLDTTLAVYGSCGGPAIGCDDNSRGAKSRVTINAVAGQAYLIRVAGASEAVGTFTLTVNPNPETHADVRVPLSYNFNGMVHNGEAGDPDSAAGFRSISDRAMRITGGVGSLEIGLEGNSGMPYSVVGDAGVLDIVHVGDRNQVDGGNHIFDADANGDEVGIQPSWLTDSNQTGFQATDVSGLSLAMGPATAIGVLYNASNGGTSFDCTLTYDDGSASTVSFNAPDWYGLQTVEPPFPGVASQTSMGTYFAAENVDTGDTGVDLNIVEGVVTTQSIIDAGLADPTGKTLASISFGNANNGPQAALAIYAVTVRDADAGTPVCRADFNGDQFLDFFDYLDYVTCFEDGNCPSGTTADFNGDDFVDFFDYLDFVTAFEAGC